KRFIEKQSEVKKDEKQLQVLNEKLSQSNYLKTFIKELIEYKQKLAKKEDSPATLTRIQKELDQIPKSFQNQLEEINNRRSVIANEIKIKQTKINDLQKDFDKIITTTIDFTTSSTMSIIEEERDIRLAQNEEDIQLDLDLIHDEKENVKKIKSKLNDLEQEIGRLEKKISKTHDDHEEAKQNNEELKDRRESQMNEIQLKDRGMKLDQQKLNFLLRKIQQHQKEFNDLQSLKEDLHKQRNEM
ncbi:unnamed protein product, partial [Rotaria sp. Silwood2]